MVVTPIVRLLYLHREELGASFSRAERHRALRPSAPGTSVRGSPTALRGPRARAASGRFGAQIVAFGVRRAKRPVTFARLRAHELAGPWSRQVRPYGPAPVRRELATMAGMCDAVRRVDRHGRNDGRHGHGRLDPFVDLPGPCRGGHWWRPGRPGAGHPAGA